MEMNNRFELTNSLSILLTDKQIEGVNEDLKFARRYLNVLVERLTKEYDSKVKESEAAFNFENPNWALKQADLMGYRRGIQRVLEIIRPIEETHD
jgi:hypothetical protein